MSETQESITSWADETFGRSGIAAAWMRFIKEVKEADPIIYEAETQETRDHIRDELADCLITLYRVASCAGVDLHEVVDSKMKINRSRSWRLNGDGTGQHI